MTLADKAMIQGELETGALEQVLPTEIDGHDSYWFVTRPQSRQARHVAQFRDWLLSCADAG